MLGTRLDEKMNVIGHDDPSCEVVTFAIEVLNAFRNGFGNFRVFKMAFSESLVGCDFEFFFVKTTKLEASCFCGLGL